MSNDDIASPAVGGTADATGVDGAAVSAKPAARGRLAPEVERVVARVIDGALANRPVRAAKHYYRNVGMWLEGTLFEAPTRGVFERLFAAERKRRKQRMHEVASETAARFGALVGDCGFAPAQGGPNIDRRDCERVVGSVLVPRSSSLKHAYADYDWDCRKAGVRSVRREAFDAIVLSPEFVATVPHGAMREWWTKKVGKASAT